MRKYLYDKALEHINNGNIDKFLSLGNKIDLLKLLNDNFEYQWFIEDFYGLRSDFLLKGHLTTFYYDFIDSAPFLILNDENIKSIPSNVFDLYKYIGLRLNFEYSILIGRKGTGKTANLYKLKEEFEKDVRNHVCVIKPIGYELKGIISMLEKSLKESEKGYLVESFWKFLIYTELSKSIFEVLESKPIYYKRDDNENELYDYVVENDSIITPEFSIRFMELSGDQILRRMMRMVLSLRLLLPSHMN